MFFTKLGFICLLDNIVVKTTIPLFIIITGTINHPVKFVTVTSLLKNVFQLSNFDKLEKAHNKSNLSKKKLFSKCIKVILYQKKKSTSK